MTAVTLTPRQKVVLSTLKKVAPINVTDISKMLAYNRETVNSIMDRLVELDLAYATYIRPGPSRKQIRIYHAGTNPDPELGGYDRDPISRPVVKKWPMHNVRDPLVCALFGMGAA